jgi:hypothetical protein
MSYFLCQCPARVTFCCFICCHICTFAFGLAAALLIELYVQPLHKSAPMRQDDPQSNSFGNPLSETDVHTSLDTQF